jgi:hypothetical protein
MTRSLTSQRAGAQGPHGEPRQRVAGPLARPAPALLVGLPAAALMILWAAHNGGYDADTWYWGALALLALLALTVLWLGPRLSLSPTAKRAIVCFAAYVAWSYLSITWASSKGDALQGSNRALLYLIVFTLFVVLPWTAEGALAVLVAFTLGVGTIAIAFLFRLAAADRVGALVTYGRLAAPTGYFNASVALFMTGALLATVLSVRRELPGLLRGLLIAMACACLQLAVVGQSRGWLFTLPFVLILTISLVRNRFRTAAAALIPAVAAIAPVHRLLGLNEQASTAALDHAAQRIGQPALLICLVAFVLGTAISWIESVVPEPRISDRGRRRLGATLVALALAVSVLGGFAATHGHPISFITRQWNSFSEPETGGNSSHFLTVGSGRYDFWRVALDATVANPIGGLGQDNFADYYITRRRTNEDPAWPHSLEMSLFASTGLVGFALFAAFLVAALIGAVRAVRLPSGLGPAVCAAALLPLVDWLVHGSVDWFWQMPALSGPALAFLGMAMAFGRRTRTADAVDPAADAPATPPTTATQPGGARLRPARLAIAGVALTAAVVALGFPYLSVREVSTASDLRVTNPGAALSDLTLAAKLDPLSADPGRLGGVIALENGLFNEAQQRFQQAISREPGGWLGWFGEGLADSALGDNVAATKALRTAVAIDKQEPVIRTALARVNSTHPLKAEEALQLLAVSN